MRPEPTINGAALTINGWILVIAVLARTNTLAYFTGMSLTLQKSFIRFPPVVWPWRLHTLLPDVRACQVLAATPVIAVTKRFNLPLLLRQNKLVFVASQFYASLKLSSAVRSLPVYLSTVRCFSCSRDPPILLTDIKLA